MPEGALEALLRAFAARDLAAAATCFADDATYREAHREAIFGRSAIAQHFEQFAATAASWDFVVDDVIAAGDRACVIYRFRSAGGDGLRGREREGCATVRLDARGLIAEWREYDGS